jgi:hypothetical protein
LVFEKNAIFFAENCRKSQKNVIITSTPCLLTDRQCAIYPKKLECETSLDKSVQLLKQTQFSVITCQAAILSVSISAKNPGLFLACMYVD